MHFHRPLQNIFIFCFYCSPDIFNLVPRFQVSRFPSPLRDVGYGASASRGLPVYSLRLPTEGWPGWVALGGW